MDRAAKVEQYRKKMKKNRRRRGAKLPGESEFELSGVATAGIAALAAGIVIFLLLALYSKNGENPYAYVTGDEFASLMSFLLEDSKPQQKDMDQAVTQGQLKDYIQKIGLSEMIPIAGGNEKVERNVLMDCYEQILDYMDLEESVQKKTILVLDQAGTDCSTKDGILKLKVNTIEFEPFHAYTVYQLDQTILGVREESKKTIALKQVLVRNITDSSIEFTYQDKEYVIPCADTDGLSSMAQCTIYVKEGKITKVKGIQGTEKEKQVNDKTVNEEKKALSQTVKVLLLNQGAIHYDDLFLTCDSSFELKRKKKKNTYKKLNIIQVKKQKLKKGGYLILQPTKDSGKIYLSDKNGNMISKGYYGSFIVYRDREGYYIVNKVKIEKYLYSVVASEMPASFGIEALKAQAVCARSYVYRQMQSDDYKKYHAQIDDSTNYQVYNKSDISESDIQAVTQTEGEVMYAKNEIVNAYYFSASCGYTSGMEIWNQKEGEYPYLKAKSLDPSNKKPEKFDLSREKQFRAFITSNNFESYDSNSPYFRWSAKAEPSICLKEFKEKIKERHKINPNHITYYSLAGKKGSSKKVSSMKGFGGVEKIDCSKRSKSGAILVLTITFEFGKVEVRSEYNIRSIIGCALEQITYADGSTNTASRFLPSAYFSISFDKKSRRYVLSGGGNGHGIGMSQYGAASMAKEGWDYQQILKFFYDGITIEKQG